MTLTFFRIERELAILNGQVYAARGMTMKNAVYAGVLGASLAMAGCATGPHNSHSSAKDDITSYCEIHPERCVIAGIIVTGLVIALASSSGSDGGGTVFVGSSGGGGAPGGGGSGGNGGSGGGVCNASDARLKTDLVLVGRTPNDLPVYTFRYLGGTERFSGVLAQDLLERPELADAASMGSDGFYRVDYSALGLELVNPDRMSTACKRAIEAARS